MSTSRLVLIIQAVEKQIAAGRSIIIGEYFSDDGKHCDPIGAVLLSHPDCWASEDGDPYELDDILGLDESEIDEMVAGILNTETPWIMAFADGFDHRHDQFETAASYKLGVKLRNKLEAEGKLSNWKPDPYRMLDAETRERYMAEDNIKE